MTNQLQFNFPAIYHLGIYESGLRWSGDSVPVTILGETSARVRVRLERDYAALVKAGTELEVRQTELQRVLGVTLQEILTDKDRWTTSLWNSEGEFVGYGVLGTKEKLMK